MNNFQSHTEDSSSLKLTYQQQDIPTLKVNNKNNFIMPTYSSTPSSSSSASFLFTHNNKFHGFPELDDNDPAATVIPAMTVVLEGRTICHRINLHHHGSYQSLAKALRQMFVVEQGMSTADDGHNQGDLDLSNAIPGHLIAYEDVDNDLLLAGDLSWK